MGIDNKLLKRKEVISKINWTTEHAECFDLLKQACTDTPILAYADYSKPFKVHTDASEIGLGCYPLPRAR